MSSVKYDKEHARNVAIKLYDTKDADLLEWLKNQPSMQGYIKRLIREDMEKQKTAQKETT